MRQFQKKISCFILLFALIGLEINAQSIQSITPSNASNSANEIKKIFGDLIGVSNTEIEEFYNHHWNDTNPYSSSCEAPSAALTSINNTDVSFEWVYGPASAPDYTQVSYLQLSTGAHHITTTNDNSITLDLTKSIFLVVFQASCGAQKSSLDIVIIERIMFSTGCDCDCRNFSEIYFERFATGLNNPSHEWGNYINTSKQFFYEISYALPIEMSASFKAEIGFDGNSVPIWVQFDENSIHNFSLNPDETFIYANYPDDGPMLGPVTFIQNTESTEGNAPKLSYSPIDSYLGQRGEVRLYECKDRPKAREDSEVANTNISKNYTLKEISNSFESLKTLEYHLPEDNSISIYLLDSQGRFIKTILNHTNKPSGSYQQNLDLSAYPNGSYFCILKTANKVTPLQLLKVK